MTTSLAMEIIQNKILLIRGHKVMIDRDLAGLYAVSTKVLNQAVKRNKERFPKDFMFTKQEKEEVVTNCDHLYSLKYSSQFPYAFTEQGVAMLSSVLNSKRAVQVNIQIMRVFVELRQFISANKELPLRLKELEHKLEDHDVKIQAIFQAIRQLMEEPSKKTKKRIGFYGD